ncbi:MYB-like transcription factor ETC3 [Pyrus ussuriensis x Pyrus communis]|uniref:MYB-like transcription factor ETC3 n=1 Tax=Pyrus ussuriensis x Pyrus communis TaxID=2448454 RepID=A0A5N5GW66_9ROSA|nr:MYB-like transcription factor ETC3 [Pyrus ussuriensis x Pyrus communis]
MGKSGGKRRKEGEKRKKGEKQGEMGDSDEIKGGRMSKREEGKEGRARLLPTSSRSKRPTTEKVSEV